MSDALVIARGLRKHYDGVAAVQDAAVEIRAGEVRGLIGANGAGKSTLVKMLAGSVRPDAGEILVEGSPVRMASPRDAHRVGIRLVPQELTILPHMSVADNIVLGSHPPSRLGILSQREIRRAATRALSQLEVDLPLDEPAGALPVIHQRLLMIARAVSARARLVILDEPTAAMSPVEVRGVLRVLRALSAGGVAAIYVSHRLDEVISICDHVTAMRNGKVVAELEAGRVSREELVRLISHGEGGSRSGEGGRLADGGSSSVTEQSTGRPLLQVEDLHVGPLRGITLKVHRGEIVGVAGLLGSGVTDLLRAVSGVAPYSRGSVLIDGRPLRPGNRTQAVAKGIAYLPGDRTLAALPNHTIRANVSIAWLSAVARLGTIRARRERAITTATTKRLGLTVSVDRPLSSLSGGNQQKALLGRWVAANPRLLVLDDPTVGVDVAARASIHRHLRRLCSNGCGALLASTDLDELAELSNRVVIVSGGVVVAELPRNLLTPGAILMAMQGKAAADLVDGHRRASFEFNGGS
jgi:ABC-type sugar transport system ATPase subunit